MSHIQLKKIVQVVAPFSLTGAVLAEFMAVLNRICRESEMDLTVELHVERAFAQSIEGYGLVEVPLAEVGEVTFEPPTGDFGPAEVVVAEPRRRRVIGRARLSVRPPSFEEREEEVADS